MYPARDTVQLMIKEWWKVAWQKAGKTLPVFFFVNAEHNNTTTKPQAKNDFTSFDAVATLYALTANNNELYFLHDYYM